MPDYREQLLDSNNVTNLVNPYRFAGGGGGGPTYGNAISVDLGTGTTVGTSATIGAINGGYDNWTQQTGFPNFTATNLQDDTGAATTADLTLANAGGNVSTRANNDASNEYSMFTRGIRVQAAATAITTLAWAQIPYSKYDVVVYLDEESISSNGDTIDIRDGTTNFYAVTNQTGQWQGSFVQITSESSGSPDTLGNYVVFSGLTSASVTISATTSLAQAFAISGIQVIERTD